MTAAPVRDLDQFPGAEVAELAGGRLVFVIGDEARIFTADQVGFLLRAMHDPKARPLAVVPPSRVPPSSPPATVRAPVPPTPAPQPAPPAETPAPVVEPPRLHRGAISDETWAKAKGRLEGGQNLMKVCTDLGINYSTAYSRAKREGIELPRLRTPADVQGLRRRCQSCDKITFSDPCECGAEA